MAKEDFDVVIAGAGAGGGFAAMALTGAGLKVLMLDRGGYYDFKQDFPLRHRNWEDQPDVLALSTQPEDAVDQGLGAPISLADQDICSRGVSFFDRNNRPYRRRGRFRYARVRGIGGSTLHYLGEAHRFPPHAFTPRSSHGWGTDWPLRYGDLAPYYERVESILGVAGAPGNPFKAPRGAFPTPAHALTTRSQLVKRGAQRLGWSLLPNSLALPTASVDQRSACRHTGGCDLGCPFGAKSSTDLTAIARARRTGLLTLEDGARVVRVETDARGRVSGFVYRHDGVLKRATASRYILALGAVETPRLLLHSDSASHPHGLGNDHGLVGRYFMETVGAILPVEAPFPVGSFQGPPLDARIWDFSRPASGGPVKTGFILGPGGGLRYHGPVQYAKNTPGFGIEHKETMRARYGTWFTLTSIAEHEPRYDNHLALSSERDAEGVPKVVVTSDYSDLDKAALRAMIESCRALARSAGLREVGQLHSSYSHPRSVHVAGGCRMGDDPAQAVTDAYGKMHGVHNLYVADASVLVSQGAGDSPSLTIQALALRTAERIAESA